LRVRLARDDELHRSDRAEGKGVVSQ
jgi:hypothetical protein